LVRIDPRPQLDGLPAFPLSLCRMTPDGSAVFLVQGLVRRADDEVKSSGIYVGMSHKGQLGLPRRLLKKEGGLLTFWLGHCATGERVQWDYPDLGRQQV
jgi:hypothetical protein